MKLAVHEVTLRFAGLTALSNLSMSVAPGSLHAVIGPNGAGKTSLFNCISGVYRPQRGRLLFDGRDLVGVPPHEIAERGVGRCFQNLALFTNLTVLENLLVGRHHLMQSRLWHDLTWFGRTRRQEIEHRGRVEEIIDFLHLERYRRYPVGILPYGVQKRVELGRALAMEPQVLLLDEPRAGLNQEETEDMARYLLDIKEELGITQILIDHDLRFVFDLADQVTVLDFGEKIAEGIPAAVRLDAKVAAAYLGPAA